MFERELEFTVHHPLEVCEARLLDMERSGCLSVVSVSVETLLKSPKRNLEFCIADPPNPLRNTNYIRIEGSIDQVADSETQITGVVYSSGGLRLLFLMYATGAMSCVWMLVGASRITIFTIVLIFFALRWIHFIYRRYYLIKGLEKTLTQPKKKKA